MNKIYTEQKIEAKESKVLVKEYEGYVQQTGAIVGLILGVGVSILLLIFVGVLGGQAYSIVQNDINNITDTTIKGYITSAITSGFKALSVTGSYIPLVALAIVIGVVVWVVMSSLRGSAGAATAL